MTVYADGLPKPQRYWAFAAVVITVILSVMDQTVANVALPSIAKDFHATPTDAIAIVSAYQLAIVVLLLPLSALGEIYGYSRIYLGGIAMFMVGSLACVLSHSVPALTLARVVQGFGAAGVMSINTALLRYIFPHSSLGRAIGINSVVVASASTLGPTFAGVTLSFAPWQWLFAVNVPLSLIAFGLGLRTLPASDRARRRFDLVSAVLTAIMFGMIITTIESLSHNPPLLDTLARVGVGVGAGVWVVLRGLHLPAPLLPVDLLRRPIFALSIATSICCFIAQMLALVSLPFYLEQTLGFGVTATGLLIMPWPLTIALVSGFVGPLTDKYPAAILNCIGLTCLAGGLILLGLMPAHPSHLNVAFHMVLCGFGFGFFQPPNNRAIMTAAPKIRSGAASGSIGTARLLGQGIGAALAALILAHNPANGAVLSLFIGAAFAGTAALVSISRLTQGGLAKA